MCDQTLRTEWQRAEPSDTNRKAALGPRVIEADHVDPHHAAATLGGDEWNNTHPCPALDHPADRVEATHARTHLQRHAEPRGMPGDVPLQCAVARQTNKRAFDDVGEDHLAP